MHFLTLLPVLFVIGCASGVGSNTPQGIQVTNQEGISGCSYVSDVYGSSPFYGVFAGPAMDGARNAALLEAQKLGATHVVFQGVSPNRDGTVATGQAYNCSS